MGKINVERDENLNHNRSTTTDLWKQIQLTPDWYLKCPTPNGVHLTHTDEPVSGSESGPLN